MENNKFLVFFLLINIFCFKNIFALKGFNSLGRGTDEAQIHTYGDCIEFENTVSTSVNHALDYRSYQERRVFTQTDLDRALEVDLSTKASFVFGSAEFNGHILNSFTMSNYALYWLISAKYNKTNQTIDTSVGFKLKENAKKVLMKNGIQAFYRMCGTHFFSGMQLGARYDVLIEIQSSTSRQLDQASAQLKAEVDLGFTSTENEFNLEYHFNKAVKEKHLHIYSWIRGGGADLKDYVLPKNMNSLSEELEKLRKHLLTDSRGVVLSWSISSYEIFPELHKAYAKEKKEKTIEMFNHKKHVLENYLSLYLANVSLKKEINRLLDLSNGKYPWFVFSAEKKLAMNQAIQKIDEQNAEIATLGNALLSKDTAAEVALKTFPRIEVKLPEPDQDFSSLGNWHVRFDVYNPIAIDQWKYYFNFIVANFSKTGLKGFVPTKNKIYFDANNNLIYYISEEKKAPIAIGSPNLLVDKNSNVKNLAICKQEYESVCSLRAIEEKEYFMFRLPKMVMQLVIYNKLGFVEETVNFDIEKIVN